MHSTIGTYTSHPNLGEVKLSKPISRAAFIIGLLEFLLGVAMLVSATLLQINDVNSDIDIDSPQFQYYGFWSAPGPLIVSVFGVIAWLLRRKGPIITFSIINLLNILLCVAQAVFVLPVTFWFKDFLTLSKCRENELESHGLEYDREGKDPDKRDCHDMFNVARLFIVLSVSCIFAIVISLGGVSLGFFGVKQMRKDQIDQLEGITNQEFRQMEEKTAMWLENNVRFSTGSTIARSDRAISESALSTHTGPSSPGYKDKSWV